MRTSRSMGGKRQSTWDTGGPIPAVRWECHTIRVWPHQITFLYMRFSKWNRALTLFTPEQRWGHHESSAGCQTGLEMGGRWGNNPYFTYFLSLRKWFQFNFTFYWSKTPSSFSAQRRKPPDYGPVGASSTLEQLSGKGWAAVKLRPGLKDTECVSHCPCTCSHAVVPLGLTCSKQLMASNPPKSLNKRAPRTVLWWRGKGLTQFMTGPLTFHCLKTTWV